MEKQNQSCRGAGLRGRERDGGGHAVGLESRAVVGNGSTVWQTLLLRLYMVRTPACLIGRQDRAVGGGAGNLRASFSRGSD